ncbi:zona pellucida sperm-binding protein 3-like isoform X2 [Antennarius striatus]
MKPLSAACLTVPLYILSTLDACQCYSYQTEPLFLSFSELAALEASSSDPSETPASPDGIQTFVLTCQEDSMEVLIRAHLLDPSLALEPHRFWLGPPSSRGRHCSAQASGDGGYIIRAPLGGCGSTVTFTQKSLLYDNLLLFSPPAASGAAAGIPVRCEYSRRYRVSSRTLEPAWGPVFPVQSAPPALNFHLKLMTGDWSRERKSSVYFLGETVNIEASVDHPPLPLRLYADSCEAALTSAAHSTRRHVFIDQHG